MLLKLLTKLSRSLSLKICFDTLPKSFSLNSYSKLAIMPPKKASSKRKVEAVSPGTPIVSDPFSAAKKSKNQTEEKQPAKEEKVVIDKEILAESQAIDIEKAVKSTVQLKINNLFAAKPSDTNGKEKAKKSKKKTEEDDDEENGDANDESESARKDLPKYVAEDFKKPSNGKDYNLKMVTFNVNGIRACIGHGLVEYLKAENADIFCLQETKCEKQKIPTTVELPNYHCYWLSGDKQGYSGVGLMSKIKPIKVTYELDAKKHSNEGRVIIAEYEQFILVNSYIPNSARGLVRLPYRMEWEVEFRKKLAELEKIKPIIWCGDLNVAHNEIDLKNPKTNTKSAGFTKEERECFTNLLTDGYFDSFRHLYPDLEEAYTWWSYMRNARQKNVGWRIDYFVMSNKLKSKLVDNNIRSKVTGSDHCPVALFLQI